MENKRPEYKILAKDLIPIVGMKNYLKRTVDRPEREERAFGLAVYNGIILALPVIAILSDLESFLK